MFLADVALLLVGRFAPQPRLDDVGRIQDSARRWRRDPASAGVHARVQRAPRPHSFGPVLPTKMCMGPPPVPTFPGLELGEAVVTSF